MSTLPSLLDALPDDDILGHVQTAGVRGFVDDEGNVVTAPLWLVCSPSRAWLAAEHDGELRAVASPHARVVRGWVTDTVEVGPWTAPLRRGTRSAAESLVERWRTGPRNGAAVRAEPRPEPPHRGKEPRGTELPGFLIRTVPVPSEGASWLLAAPTRSEQPFDQDDGSLAKAQLWVAVSDEHQVLFAEGPHHTWSVAVEQLIYRLSPTGVEVTADTRKLRGGRKADPELLLAWKLSELPTDQRWATLATTRLEAGDARDAVRLLSEALDRHLAVAWPLVARIFLALGDPDRALMAAHEALRVTPGLDVDAAAQACRPERDRQRLAKAKVDRPFAWALWRHAYEGLADVDVPDGLPWPPASAEGLWAAALGSHGRAADALPLADEDDLDQLEARAALLTADGRPEAAEAWARAAHVAHDEGRDHAASLLDRALAQEKRPDWHATRAAWAWAEADRDVAVVHWEAAMDLGLGPEDHPPLPPEAERCLAQLADDEHPAHAAAAWRRHTIIAPDDAEGWQQAVARAPSPLAAADLQQAWCSHADTLEEAPAPRFERWVQLGRLRAESHQPDDAVASLFEALAEDFLRPEAFRSALQVAQDASLHVPSDWWAHVASLLAGAPDEGTGLEPVEHLDAGELDALHPAGTGWLDRIRHQLDEAEPPPRGQLTRGLARLEPSKHRDLATIISRCTTALGLPAPDLHVFRGDGAFGCSGWPLDPPVVLIGHDHLDDGERHLPPAALGFLVAVELVHLAAGHPVLAFDADLVGTSRSLYRSFGSYASTAETVVDVITLVPGVDQIAKLQTIFSLSRRVFATRSAVDKVSSVADPLLRKLGLATDDDDDDPSPTGLSREGLDGAALQFRLQADRAALLIVGDLRAAVHGILASATESIPLTGEGPLAERLADTDALMRVSALAQFAAGLGQDE